MVESCLADRLANYLTLTERERGVLAQLESTCRHSRRGSLIWREQDRTSELFVLRSGWLISHVLMSDGARQIIRLHLPGEIIGLGSLVIGGATETVTVVSDAQLCPFDRITLRTLFDEHPRLAALILALAQIERIALTDRLASLGRTPARARVAALMIDILARLRVATPGVGNAFDLPMTQEEIGDATGLTAVHVNRMIRALTEEGLIARSGTRLELRDEPKLKRIANYVERYQRLDTSWLPASR